MKTGMPTCAPEIAQVILVGLPGYRQLDNGACSRLKIPIVVQLVENSNGAKTS